MRRTVAALLIALTVPAAASASRIVTLGRDANNSTVRLQVRDVLAIRLPGSPESGYRWIVASVDGKVLAYGVLNFEASTIEPDGPGTYTLPFKATAAGQTRLELAYVRVGRRGGATMTFAMTVRVSRA